MTNPLDNSTKRPNGPKEIHFFDNDELYEKGIEFYEHVIGRQEDQTRGKTKLYVCNDAGRLWT
jgi:hypothetical protein